MSRWKYRTETVTVGENSVEVRQFTQKERGEFAQASKKIKAGELQPMDLPPLVLKYGAPELSEEDILSMPPDLADACVRKIMELSGLGKDDSDADDHEKKEP